MVENSLDRLPPHPDPALPTESLHDLRGKLGLTDGWCCTNPAPDWGFAFKQPSGGSRSWIDRIYITEEMFNCTLDWKIEQPDVTTD